MLGLLGSSDASNLRGDRSFGMSPAPITALSSTYPLWQNDVDDLLHLSSTGYSSIPRYPPWPVCPVLA